MTDKHDLNKVIENINKYTVDTLIYLRETDCYYIFKFDYNLIGGSFFDELIRNIGKPLIGKFIISVDLDDYFTIYFPKNEFNYIVR